MDRLLFAIGAQRCLHGQLQQPRASVCGASYLHSSLGPHWRIRTECEIANTAHSNPLTCPATLEQPQCVHSYMLHTAVCFLRSPRNNKQDVAKSTTTSHTDHTDTLQVRQHMCVYNHFQQAWYCTLNSCRDQLNLQLTYISLHVLQALIIASTITRKNQQSVFNKIIKTG